MKSSLKRASDGAVGNMVSESHPTWSCTDDEERLAALVRGTSAAFFRVDAHRNVVEMSPALERLTGFRADDIVGRSCLLVHRCEECLAGCGVFDNGEVTDRELELYHADGSTIRVSKSGRAFFDADGTVVGAIEVVEPLDPRTPAEVKADEADAVEAHRIRKALERSRYNRSAAARSLGMSRTTLWRKMKSHGLLRDEPSERT